MKKDLQILESRNTVSRNRKNRTRAMLVGSSMAIFLLAGANNPVVASAEEMSSIVTTAEVTDQTSFITNMEWKGEAIVTIDTDDSDGDGETTDLEAIENNMVVMGQDYPIQTANEEMIKESFADKIVTDTEAYANQVPTLFLNLTAYETQAADEFTIVSAGETITIGSEFMIYIPNVVDQDIAEGIFTEGPLYVQNIDGTTGLPTGTIYEVDDSFYYSVDYDDFVGNEFYIPMTVDGVSGFTYFFKESGVATITDAFFYGDTDGDGLLDIEESEIGTDPNKPDTDGDGLSDYEEVYLYSTDPIIKDTDEDGLNDYDEVITYMSDPYDPDSDNDGLTDGVEVNQYDTDPTNPDTDGDGIIDGKNIEEPYVEDPNVEEPNTEEPSTEVKKPETLAYTGNNTNVGVIAGTIGLALFVIKKIIKL